MTIGQIDDPSSGKYFSLPFLPATLSSLSQTLEVLFELTRRPSRALNSPCALLLELQRSKDTDRCAGGPRTTSRTTDANLDCAFVENALVYVVPKIGWAWAPLSAPPGLSVVWRSGYTEVSVVTISLESRLFGCELDIICLGAV